jgi:hypothetical protein
MPLTAEPPTIDDLDAGVIEEARARQRRHRRTGAAVTTLAAGTAAIVLAFAGGGGGGSHGARASQSPGRAPGTAGRASLAACLSRGGAKLEGKPSESLLSILGVLRRQATPLPPLPRLLRNGLFLQHFGDPYVNYVRLARVVDGSAYYLVPARSTGCFTSTGQDRVMIFGNHAGGGGPDASEIEDGQGDGITQGWFTGTRITMLVPDDVATVSWHYPAGPLGGFNQKHMPAVTITARPVNNLVVVTVPRGGAREGEPDPLTWRAANGRVLLTKTCQQDNGQYAPVCTTRRN